MKRLGAPLQDPKYTLKVLFYLFASCLIIFVLFVTTVIWAVSRPVSLPALPQELTQVRLQYSGQMTEAKRKLSEEVLIAERDSKEIISLANSLLARRAWYSVIDGGGFCELRLTFMGATDRPQAYFRLSYGENRIFIVHKQRALQLERNDAAPILSKLNHPELLELRQQACAAAG